MHHVMVRGIEKQNIFQDKEDRQAFVDRLRSIVLDTGTRVLAWALLDNHVHLLLISGPAGLPTFMRRLLTGYAIGYNRRHQRFGHLFQNRYKSILCELDTYLLELVRYIHLNPLRAEVVKDLEELEMVPWCGHGVLTGRQKNDWQDRDFVLGFFGSTARKAVRAYREFVAAGKDLGPRPELVGGGLVRSLGGWSQVLSLRQRGEPEAYDERILGSGDFVQAVLEEADRKLARQMRARKKTGAWPASSRNGAGKPGSTSGSCAPEAAAGPCRNSDEVSAFICTGNWGFLWRRSPGRWVSVPPEWPWRLKI